MSDDKFAEARGLLHRLAEVAHGMGLNLHQRVIILDDDGSGPDMIQAVFIVTTKALQGPVSEDQAAIDDQFEELARQAEREIAEEKAQEARKSAMNELGSWLDDK